jgi:hypothetical protein
MFLHLFLSFDNQRGKLVVSGRTKWDFTQMRRPNPKGNTNEHNIRYPVHSAKGNDYRYIEALMDPPPPIGVSGEDKEL